MKGLQSITTPSPPHKVYFHHVFQERKVTEVKYVSEICFPMGRYKRKHSHGIFETRWRNNFQKAVQSRIAEEEMTYNMLQDDESSEISSPFDADEEMSSKLLKRKFFHSAADAELHARKKSKNSWVRANLRKINRIDGNLAFFQHLPKEVVAHTPEEQIDPSFAEKISQQVSKNRRR